MMEVTIVDASGKPLRFERRTPFRCQDKCNDCGDCLLGCAPGEECFGMSALERDHHHWVMTEEELAEFDAEQAAPQPIAA